MFSFSSCSDSLWTLLQNATDMIQNTTAFLLENTTKVYYKMCQLFYYNMQQLYYKMWLLLQNETVVLQNSIAITKYFNTKTMKFGQLIKYNMGNSFLEKSDTKCGGETSRTSFS